MLGDLWYPHVYMPAQNPWDISGANAFGRWMYGPWFYPPTANLEVGTVPNPYYDPVNAPWEPPEMPGTPNPSMPGEAFMDTPIVNGTVFPFLEVEPKAYRYRILNASDDRSLNLSLYLATGIVGSITLTDSGSGYMTEPAVTIAPGAGDTTGHGAQAFATIDPVSGSLTSVTITVVGSGYTADPTVTIAPPTAGVQASATATFFTTNESGFPSEVGMVPVTGTKWLPPFDMSGVPDPANAGPDWIQIGTEGGFLPAPAVIPAGPITWNTNPTTFNFGNVVGHSLCLGTAERADVIVDFSAFAGQTLILYNDAPAAFPAPDPRYDYYTNDQDQTDIGGAPTTPPGVGPNTRTIMQIRVAGTVTPGTETSDVTLANLNSVWAKTAAKRGVFEVSQDPIIIPQAAYNSAYNNSFTSAPAEEYIQVNKYSKTISPIDSTGAIQVPVTLPIQPKAVHDEMGGVYDTKYGRMSGMLGLSLPATTSRLAQFLPMAMPVRPLTSSEARYRNTGRNSQRRHPDLEHQPERGGYPYHPFHLFNASSSTALDGTGLCYLPIPTSLAGKRPSESNPLEQTIIACDRSFPPWHKSPFWTWYPIVSAHRSDHARRRCLTPPAPGWMVRPDRDPMNGILNHNVNFGWEVRLPLPYSRT